MTPRRRDPFQSPRAIGVISVLVCCTLVRCPVLSAIRVLVVRPGVQTELMYRAPLGSSGADYESSRSAPSDISSTLRGAEGST